MSAEFRSLVELALAAPLVNPKLIMSCVDFAWFPIAMEDRDCLLYTSPSPRDRG